MCKEYDGVKEWAALPGRVEWYNDCRQTGSSTQVLQNPHPPGCMEFDVSSRSFPPPCPGQKGPIRHPGTARCILRVPTLSHKRPPTAFVAVCNVENLPLPRSEHQEVVTIGESESARASRSRRLRRGQVWTCDTGTPRTRVRQAVAVAAATARSSTPTASRPTPDGLAET